MAKVILFIRDELYSGEADRNNAFRDAVKAFVPHMLEDITYAEYCVNTPSGYKAAFNENPDCEMVFTTQNALEAQWEACNRKILVYEWRCFSSNKLVPVRVKLQGDALKIYKTDYYGIRVSN